MGHGVRYQQDLGSIAQVLHEEDLFYQDVAPQLICRSIIALVPFQAMIPIGRAILLAYMTAGKTETAG